MNTQNKVSGDGITTTTTTTTTTILNRAISCNEVEPKSVTKKEEVEEKKKEEMPQSSTTVKTLKSDKSVCTRDTLQDDLQRALTYEAVFNSLLEQKMLAMKRDCEERTRLKRMKRKSLGRRLFSRKLFTSRKSISGRLENQDQQSDDQRAELSPAKLNNATAKKPVMRSRTVDDIDVDSTPSSTSQGAISLPKSKVLRDIAATANVTSVEGNADDSVASSTMSNSSGQQEVRRHVLVRAQTHTPAADTHTLSSHSSGELAVAAQGSTNGEAGQVSSLEQRTVYDTASMATGTVARLHSSTMAEGSLTSMRDSIESLSFGSSRCTVSFGATEIIPEDTASLVFERVRAAKRLRILEAKSISAQCSPIFPPRHVPQTTPIRPVVQKTTPEILLKTTNTSQLTIRPVGRLLPNQLSYTDSMPGSALDTAYSRHISRQNTSEDSANLTLSTLLNQSDSLSLQTPAYFAASSVNDRGISKSASLLAVNKLPRQPMQQLPNFRDNGPINRPLVSLDSTIIPRYSLEQPCPHYTAAVISATDDTTTTTTAMDAAKLNRMTSTSTASSTAAATGCFAATKSKDKQRVICKSLAAGQSGSDDEYRKKKRKYKRYHRCSDPALVYPTPNMLQHCVISMPTNANSQFPYDENYVYDDQMGDLESDKHNDLEQIMPDTSRKHHRHRHHRHKKRRRHKKSKILEQESQVVKVVHPDDLSQRARWTIIVTACLLLLMCLMLVGITLRMAPIIDDMVRQENERLMKETMDRARFGKNFTESASLISTAAQLMSSATLPLQQQQVQYAPQEHHNQEQQQQQQQHNHHHPHHQLEQQ